MGRSNADAFGGGGRIGPGRVQQPPSHRRVIPSATLLGFGTVVAEGESLGSPPVIEVAGAPAAGGYHAFFEQNDVRLSSLPNADLFVALATAVPEETRHLELHTGHLTVMNEIDRAVMTPAGAAALTPLTGTVQEIRGRVDLLVANGITEIAFQPVGDVPTELTTMAAALRPWMS